MDKVEIFTGPGCSYCDRAKTALRERGIAFVERDIGEGAVLAEFRDRLPRTKSIPQIFVDGMHIGGFEDLRLLLTQMEREKS